MTIFWMAFLSLVAAGSMTPNVGRIGIIGLDTSHSVQFTEMINDPAGDGVLERFEVVAAYPQGSTTIPASYERIPGYTDGMRDLGVEIVGSIEELLERVDFVLLETNDGTVHLDQAMQVISAGKPLFVDKPMAASLEDVIAIYRAAEQAGVPIFSSSSLRYTENAQAIRGGSIGDVRGAFAYSPAPLEPLHPDLYWYGIHAVEMLFTVMGEGCKTVVRTHTKGADSVTCTWDDGRIGTVYGSREGPHEYGGTAFGQDAISEIGPYEGNELLVRTILRFFETGKAPVAPEETIEIYAFMSAAEESKHRGGIPVNLADVLEPARRKAEAIPKPD